MAFSVTQAARSFDRSTRTAADLKRFWEHDPAGAASWLSEVVRASGNAPAELAELAAASRAGAPLDQLERLVGAAVGENPALFEGIGSQIQLAGLQASRAATIGWAANIEPASFVGHLQKTTEGVVQFVTATGTYQIDLSATDWRDEIDTAFLRDRDGMAAVLTLKGFPSADGKSIHVQQFAPGADPDFFNGRVRVRPGRVFVQTFGVNRVEITHPQLAKLLAGDPAQGLASWADAGVILRGRVTTDAAAGTRTYDELPNGLLILGRITRAHVGSDEKYDYHELETGYGKVTGARSEKGMFVPPQALPDGAQWDAGDTSRGDVEPGTGPRVFFFARILGAEEQFPDTVKFPNVLERRVEISMVSDQGDNGVHASGRSPLTSDFAVLARAVPASAPGD